MALLEDELKIVSVGNLMKTDLRIPDYQRPYRWSEASTNTLFEDTYYAYHSGIPEYRLGSVILHKGKNNTTGHIEYNMVDGQQRTTTLSILLFVLGENWQRMLNEKYSLASELAVKRNYALLNKRVGELSEDERRKYKDYLLENATVVQIVTENEQEAFQFFDSQNSRGKSLKPHDLLKSYHLREMTDESEQSKLELVERWETVDQRNLEELFSYYLYPMLRWQKGKDGLDYNSNKIDVFKGLVQSSTFNFAIYHKASNVFVEQFNASDSGLVVGSGKMNQFQLTQPIIAGKRFFTWTLHYVELLKQIQELISDYHVDSPLPSNVSGDRYVRRLYEASLMFFVDRFSLVAVDDSVMHQLFTWSYTIRIIMRSVSVKTINKYALGRHDRLDVSMNLFAKMSEMFEPSELNMIVFTEPVERNEKYEATYELMRVWNRW